MNSNENLSIYGITTLVWLIWRKIHQLLRYMCYHFKDNKNYIYSNTTNGLMKTSMLCFYRMFTTSSIGTFIIKESTSNGGIRQFFCLHSWQFPQMNTYFHKSASKLCFNKFHYFGEELSQFFLRSICLICTSIIACCATTQVGFAICVLVNDCLLQKTFCNILHPFTKISLLKFD